MNRFKIRGLWDFIQKWVGRYGRTPKIGLALGSGVGWGVAHVGVLAVFKEHNIPISFLSGSSAGSFVGALYAGGVEGELLEVCGRDYKWRDAGRLNYFPKMGMATNDRMVSYLQKRIGNPKFEDLRIPLYVAVTDLTSGQIKFFHEGPVIPAVQASCAIPGIFAPVEIKGELYCDGGILNKVPCKILREMGAEVVIGVELSSRRLRKRPTNIIEVIGRAFDIVLFRQAFSDCETADLLIYPNVDDIYEFGFDQNPLLIPRGMEATLMQLEKSGEGLSLSLKLKNSKHGKA